MKCIYLGGEDDDMYYRLRSSGIGFERPRNNIVYTMLEHKPQAHNDRRMEIINKNIGRFRTDGLTTINSTLIGILKYPLFTKLFIDVGSPNY